jgi:hypothetical protein
LKACLPQMCAFPVGIIRVMYLTLVPIYLFAVLISFLRCRNIRVFVQNIWVSCHFRD